MSTAICRQDHARSAVTYTAALRQRHPAPHSLVRHVADMDFGGRSQPRAYRLRGDLWMLPALLSALHARQCPYRLIVVGGGPMLADLRAACPDAVRVQPARGR